MNAYALTESELKTKALAALDNIKNCAMENTMDMRINTINPSGENTFLFDQLMDSRSWVDYEKSGVRMQYMVNIKTKDHDQSIPGQAYIAGDTFYQNVNGQWFKRPVNDVDKDIFKSAAQEKELLSNSQIEIITQDPLYVVVVPDKEKASKDMVEKLRATLGDKNGAFTISVETMTFEYWFDSDCNIKKKKTLSRIKVASPNQPTQLIEETSSASFEAYNHGVDVEPSDAAKSAQPSPLK